MKATDYNETLTIEDAAKKRLSEHDYYSRGVEAGLEKINNIVELTAKLIGLLAEHKILDAETISNLLNMNVEE